ncbi:hypothetical protein DE146DRAFT_652708 [Phaeosphaeria sp. MPI-PUGE-AT-0046c]|nr:hypothetical protein DE146DRAFT_652708 [Phaeosphaeria sp. MPI-PUGE-AT-0046c]
MFHRKKEEESSPPTFDESEDFGVVWQKLISHYERITKEPLDCKLTFESFQVKVGNDLKNSSLKSHEKARHVLNNVGFCLEQICGNLGQIASIAFPPSAPIFAAISLVLSVAGKIEEVINGFVALMERAAGFFTRLNKVLEAKTSSEPSLQAEFRRPAYEILACFLQVLQKSRKFASSKREKAKVMFGILLFNSDAGISESLGSMESQISNFTSAEVDSILTDVKGIARYLNQSEEVINNHHTEIMEYLEASNKVTQDMIKDVRTQLKATQDVRINEKQKKENLEKIRTTFRLKKLDDQDLWSIRQDDLGRSRVKNTGTWLEQKDVGFVHWSEQSQKDVKIFLLEGGSGFGKTYVTNFAITHLRDKIQANPGTSPIYLAYYYYMDAKEESPERLVGSIIYQFAQQSVPYAKAVAEACARTSNISSAQDRWTNLFLGMQKAMKGTYFILVDGVDNANDQNADLKDLMVMIGKDTLLSNESAGVAIRCYISGTEEIRSELPEVPKGIRHLALEEEATQLINAGDVDLITRARVKDLCKAKPDLKAIVGEKQIRSISDGLRGNYRRLEATLAQIRLCDTESKVEEAIKNIGDNIIDSQKKTLKKLNASLDTASVRHLNELLLWISGLGSWSVEQLQCVLYLKFGELFLLQSAIKTEFAEVLKIDKHGSVSIKSDDFVKILREDGVGEAQSTLTQPEIDLCRRFVQKAFDDVDYTRFRFGEYFAGLANKVPIQLGDTDAVNLEMVKTCVRVLWERKEDAKLEKLKAYAAIWFYEHLKTLTDRLDSFDASRETMKELGGRIMDLFYDPLCIDAWFAEDQLWTLRYDWIGNDDCITSMIEFLKNPHVAKGYDKDKEKNDWFKSVIAEGANRFALLARVGVRLATTWFSRTADPIFLLFSYGILARMEGRTLDVFDTTATLSEIEHYVEWAKKSVSLAIPEHMWDYRIGATYRNLKYHKEALALFQKAEPHLPTEWGLMTSTANAHRDLKNFQEALKYYKKFKDLAPQYLETDKWYRALYWESVPEDEGGCYREAKEFDAAAECFRNMLKHDFEDESQEEYPRARALSGLFLTWIEADTPEMIIQHMESWSKDHSAEQGIAYWFEKMILSDNIHSYVLIAAKQTGTVDEVCSLYQEAIDAMATLPPKRKEQQSDWKEHMKSVRIHLRHYQAVIRFHGSQSPQHHQQGVSAWEGIIKESDYWAAYKANRQLAPALLDKAVAIFPEEHLSTTDSTYLERLVLLCISTAAVVRDARDNQSDPRLCLTRFYQLTGNHEQALLEIQDKLCSVFNAWPEQCKGEASVDNDDNSSGTPLEARYPSLAQILTVLDRDDDAIAAWQAIRPKQVDNKNAIDVASSTDTEAVEPQQSDTSTSEATPTPANETEATNTAAPKASTEVPDAYIKYYHCDAECGTFWKEMLADCYVCRNCLCLQLCAGCYKKFQTGDLKLQLCSMEHKHLYLPPFDHDLWQNMSGDMMLVNKTAVPRQEWIDKLREEFEVKQDQIAVHKLKQAMRNKAAGSIAAFWRKKQEQKRETKPEIPAT